MLEIATSFGTDFSWAAQAFGLGFGFETTAASFGRYGDSAISLVATRPMRYIWLVRGVCGVYGLYTASTRCGLYGNVWNVAHFQNKHDIQILK